MSNNELQLHPTGQIGFGAGTLKQATLGRFSVTNGAALTHSLAKSPSGFVLGNLEVSGTIEFEIPETGLERDIIGRVVAGQRQNFRFKDATDTYELEGVLNQADWETSRGSAIRVTANYIAKLIR